MAVISPTLGESFTQSGRRAICRATAQRPSRCRSARVTAKLRSSAGITLGQENIQLVSSDTFGALQMPHHFAILFDGMTENIGDNWGPVGAATAESFSC